MIESLGIDLKGKDACMVGRSAIVGRPTAMMLAKKHATVTLCHRHTERLPEKTIQADILVVAIGHPHYIKADWIKKNAIVIDVGINVVGGHTVGDVEFEEAAKRAKWITPVPGGVGPVTVTMVMKNVLEAYKLQRAST